jgi:uncharacterized CHY-type Zn-finger protein
LIQACEKHYVCVECFEKSIENHFMKKILEERLIDKAIHVKCGCGNGKRKYEIEKEGEDVCNEEYKKDDMRKCLKGSNLALLNVLEEIEKKDEEIKKIKEENKKKDEEIKKIKEEKDEEIKRIKE